MNTFDRMRLDGKVAVITGGGGGIGQVYARALADAGASVVLADLDAARADEAAATLAKDGFQAIGVQADITDRAATDAMAAKATEAFGGIDILVNNAALMAEIPQVDILDLPAEWFDRVMRVNVLGAINCIASVKASMVERGGGRIINQVSAGAFHPGGIYGASKIALVNLSAGFARSLGPLGINVNAIAPGLVENDAAWRSLPADHPGRTALAAAIPGKKSAPAEDLLGVLLLLASPAGEWINGQTISVDGGWVMRL
ncbi:MAG TPA: SDR family oxidoreductase [Yinghuangia sp.]|uniref:SDR family oxidoreductase n=1 Tax=Yinghuangia sp. YIM S10712 TaxID=3436930 RepID=UPI002C1A997D|nr:SDR family oxidoreductase [Yinghuangia sp.]